ncbi:putative Pol polyprotein [Cricetulus griseus]|uniref:Putative Pol polyprotein n=1 Tax=Cricetulus griseus TaxID=10029 RepID=A0A061IGN8_CRIGR|nr:putative Pol polyprotein [Cricetulus griseus]
MDVTHIHEFGTLTYVHVSVDTRSGVIHATPLSGEKARKVIAHCLEAWAAWGMPQQLKTDNEPAYTAVSFSAFCKQMHIDLKHGLPYNPQGQGIVERAHRTLKECLIKQKGGIGQGRTPKERISLALLTLNFFQLDVDGRLAADR